MASAYLSEVFVSLQGEGPGAGCPALFVRFAGCNLACSYCDTPASRDRQKTFSIHEDAGERRMANPVDCDDLIGAVGRSSDRVNLAVLTGGEPLLQPSAVGSIARGLKARGLRIHLETNGTLPQAMKDIGDRLDIVVMDIKLPCTQAGRNLAETHEEFLSAAGRGRVAAKVVIPAQATDAEVLDGARLVARVDPAIPVFLQPEFSGSEPVVTGERLLRLLHELSGELKDVRISIQMHKVLGIR